MGELTTNNVSRHGALTLRYAKGQIGGAIHVGMIVAWGLWWTSFSWRFTLNNRLGARFPIETHIHATLDPAGGTRHAA